MFMGFPFGSRSTAWTAQLLGAFWGGVFPHGFQPATPARSIGCVDRRPSATRVGPSDDGEQGAATDLRGPARAKHERRSAQATYRGSSASQTKGLSSGVGHGETGA